MTGYPSDHQHELVDRLLPTDGSGSTLGRAEWDRLFQHLRECRSCQAYFESRRREVLGKDAELLSRHEQAAILTSLLSADDPLHASGEASSSELLASRKTRLGAQKATTSAGCVLAIAAIGVGGTLLVSKASTEGLSAAHDTVSARFFCMVRPGKVLQLSERTPNCPSLARVIIEPTAAPANRLPVLTLVTCSEEFDCRVFSSSRFEAVSRLRIEGPTLQQDEDVTVIVIWSQEVIDADTLEHAVRNAQTSRLNLMPVKLLRLPAACLQVGLTVRVDAL